MDNGFTLCQQGATELFKNGRTFKLNSPPEHLKDYQQDFYVPSVSQLRLLCELNMGTKLTQRFMNDVYVYRTRENVFSQKGFYTDFFGMKTTQTTEKSRVRRTFFVFFFAIAKDSTQYVFPVHVLKLQRFEYANIFRWLRAQTAIKDEEKRNKFFFSHVQSINDESHLFRDGNPVKRIKTCNEEIYQRVHATYICEGEQKAAQMAGATRKLFNDNDISGEMFMRMSESDLDKLNITSFGLRLTLNKINKEK